MIKYRLFISELSSVGLKSLSDSITMLFFRSFAFTYAGNNDKILPKTVMRNAALA